MKNIILQSLQDKDFAELFRKSGVSFLLRILGQILGFALTFIIAHYFGASGLGDYVLAIIVLRVFTLFSKLGMDTASIRFIAAFASQNKFKSIIYFRRKLVVLLMLLSLLFSCIMYFNAEWISVFIGARESFIQLNSFLVLPMAFFILHYQSLRGLKKIAEFSFFFRVSETLFTIISILVIMQFVTSDYVPIYGYVSSICIVSFLSFLSYTYWFNIKSKSQKNEQIDVLPLKKILHVSIPLMFAQSVQFIMAWTDKIMLGSMMTAEYVGIYHIAFKLSMFASITLMAVNSIASPKFAELYANNDIKTLKKVVSQSTKLIFWSSIPLVILFFSFPSFFLGIFGAEFKVATLAFLILSSAKLISALCGSVGNLLQMTGEQLLYMKILSAGAILNVVINYLLIPIYGINGAAIASLFSMSFWNVSMVYFVQKKLGILTLYIPFIKR